MPHTKTARKRLRQDEKRRRHNRTTMKGVKKELRSFLDALKEGKSDEAKTAMSQAAKKLDKAAARNVIHKNKAARLKSRMAKKLADMQQAA